MPKPKPNERLQQPTADAPPASERPSFAVETPITENHTTPNVEQEVQIETNREQAQAPENKIKNESEGSALKRILGKSKRKKPTVIPQVRDELSVEVEHILEDGMGEAFRELTPIQQQEFKIKGEQTALQIRDLLKGAHVKVKTIFKLIFEWLRLLPGVNKFFLEQEAKIKAERILSLRKKR